MENFGSQLVDDGIQHMRNGRYEEAELLFDQAIKTEKGKQLSRAYYNKGVLRGQFLNDIQAALACYHESVEVDANNQLAWNNLGETLLRYERPKEALKAFETALKLAPNALYPRINLAYTFNRLSRFTDAIDLLLALLNQEDRYTDVVHANGFDDNKCTGKILSELGLALLQTQKIHDAYAYFQQAFQYEENDYQTCYNIGFIADMLGEYDKALTFYDKAIALDNKEGKGYQGKACTYIHTKQFDKALPLIEKAIERLPHSFEGYYNLACIYAGLNQKENVFNAVKKTIELAPPQIRIQMHIKKDPDFSKFVNDQAFLALLG